MVVTSPPSACAARTVQDFTACPSRRTVQAPQSVVSQPTCVPVRPQTSRRNSTSSRRGSTSRRSVVPLTLMETSISGLLADLALLAEALDAEFHDVAVL